MRKWNLNEGVWQGKEERRLGRLAFVDFLHGVTCCTRSVDPVLRWSCTFILYLISYIFGAIVPAVTPATWTVLCVLLILRLLPVRREISEGFSFNRCLDDACIG